MILYGNELAKQLKEELKEKIVNLKRKPGLAVILVGDDKASLSYIRSKKKATEEVGIDFYFHHLPGDIGQKSLIDLINKLNNDDKIDGILVQLPLPKGYDVHTILQHIRPDKDVDGLTETNAGKLSLGYDGLVPCTALGVLEILKAMGAPIKGQRAVVIGRSNLVGIPTARLLNKENATVTICHRHTQDLRSITKTADILVVAIGNPHFIDATYIKEGAYVVDVGINYVDGKICGDVDFDSVAPLTSAITPVPKGVGPMTVCALMMNVYKAYHYHQKDYGN